MGHSENNREYNIQIIDGHNYIVHYIYVIVFFIMFLIRPG